MTNYERIKKLSKEGMARFIEECEGHDIKYNSTVCGECVADYSCNDCVRRWLDKDCSSDGGISRDSYIVKAEAEQSGYF